MNKPLTGMKVLVVDDVTEYRTLMGRQIGQLGGKVYYAFDGQSAILELHRIFGQSVPPDAIVTDLRMPRTGGFELIEILKNTPRFSSIPIVIVSGSISPAEEKQAKMLGVRECLVKPFTLAQLGIAIQRAIDTEKV